jgi:hypothetical protein
VEGRLDGRRNYIGDDPAAEVVAEIDAAGGRALTLYPRTD